MTKYERIYKDLETKINKDFYKEGDFLPTEIELSQQYQASRDTVRKALSLLTKAGLILKKQGRGTQVIRHHQIMFPISELTSYQELVSYSNLDSKTNVIAIDKLIVDETLSKLTGFSKNSLGWRVTRQRVVESVASVLDIDYLSKTLVPIMTREIAEHSIYQYLEKELHLAIDFALKEVTIDQITDRDKILLDLGSDQHVVSVKSKVYLSNNNQFQFTESRHKLEKFKFLDFARRRAK
ncbi:trehalose operon transcriptional repressor [Streptococcus pyogenes]|uniref:trehalose operon repressor n=1 Tax=Streptococcus pyogenes TaxID=1314 RepID=UPI0010A0F7B9|nr:trehalose operon repressor [Streptococcus pyogenes]VGR59689.1 trehalose operon transcriptional repressor [Streptococcus pyogenes]VGR87067.1 trehalose operon transcriptional repressor [Streptococcus pyogenes]VGS27001.1 trehalose operon transcriptional repressor [Streptococcus pyogenes]VHG13215.1 HTH-type transcriptional regulator ymfC [Streptococcus pyogenes]VHK56941.1 trehalose operon transcriptional repressor [Streptococcus pyogenes]